MTGWWDVWGLGALDALLWAAARGEEPSSPALRRLRRYLSDRRPTERRAPSLWRRVGQPAGTRAVLALRRLTSQARRRRAADYLARAALEWAPETLVALALASGAALALAAPAIVHLSGAPGPDWAWGAFGWGIGYLQPGLWVRRRGAFRIREFERELPGALDMLVIGLRAGLSLPAAVAEYAGSGRGVATTAFHAYLTDLALGRTPEEGMAEMVRRYPGDALAVVAATLAQSVRLGSPLADALEAQASHLRRLMLRRAEESARGLAVRLVVPLVVCVFPQVFIVGLGPVALKLLGPGGVLH
ncbi:MAG TPA: type II secretion system F family protein [bacterium]|nr:type II secretion system F family protein [bacterium]